MDRLIIIGAVIVIAAVVALIARRGQRDAPVRTGHTAPVQLDRSEFVRPDAEWLVVVFSSATCASCAAAWEKVRHLESSVVAVQDVELNESPELHERYRIDAVPIVVVADREGATKRSFIGPPPTAELWAAVAELRETD